MTQTNKPLPAGKNVETQATGAPPHGFKSIALPALAAALRQAPQQRAKRRTPLVLDPARYVD